MLFYNNKKNVILRILGGVFSFSLSKDIMFLQGRTGSQ